MIIELTEEEKQFLEMILNRSMIISSLNRDRIKSIEAIEKAKSIREKLEKNDH